MLAITIIIKLFTRRNLQITKHLSHDPDTFHELLDLGKILLALKFYLQGASSLLGYADIAHQGPVISITVVCIWGMYLLSISV